MKKKFRLYQPKAGDCFYTQNNTAGQQESLGASDQTEALRLLCAENEAEFQPAFNAHLARTYLSAGDPEIAKHDWQWVMDLSVRSKVRLATKTQERYASSIAEKALDPIRNLRVIETRPEHFLEVMLNVTVSTNVFLRRLQSYAVGMKWLLWPVLTSRQWARARFKDRRGITWDEHQVLLSRQTDLERCSFLELLWHVGAAPVDLVSLTAENVNWPKRVITYIRAKTKKLAVLRFGEEVSAILSRLPKSGPLFPKLSRLSSA